VPSGGVLEKIIARVVVDAEGAEVLSLEDTATFVFVKRQTVRAHPFTVDELMDSVEGAESQFDY
jgi:hypothetical protein